MPRVETRDKTRVKLDASKADDAFITSGSLAASRGARLYWYGNRDSCLRGSKRGTQVGMRGEFHISPFIATIYGKDVTIDCCMRY